MSRTEKSCAYLTVSPTMVRNHAIESSRPNERLFAHSTANSSQRRSERRKSTGPRGRNGCRTCRSRHVRCDETRPTCDNCVRSNRACNWNHDIKLAHDVRSSSFRAALATHDEVAHSDSERVAPAIHQHTARYGYPDFAACIDLIGRGPDGGHRVNIPEAQWVPSAILQHRLEAKLFQFYIDVAGPWLDVTSPSRHFARTVPRLALENPVLLCACLTFAAKAALPENSLSEQYHNACIKLLIPLLSDEVFVSTDETLLATLVILRHVEQYMIVTEDKGAHLSGAFGLIASQRVLPPHDSLPGAALWTYMRQDIRSALLNRTPPKLTPQHRLQVSNLDEPYDVCESVWADRACHLAALACSFAWDSLGTYGVDGEHLEILLESWRDGASKDYLPYHDSNAECRFLATWHGEESCLLRGHQLLTNLTCSDWLAILPPGQAPGEVVHLQKFAWNGHHCISRTGGGGRCSACESHLQHCVQHRRYRLPVQCDGDIGLCRNVSP